MSGPLKCKPLPLRRQFWRTLPPLIREGTVLFADELEGLEDNRNAAQSILIDYIEKRLIDCFVRPELVRSCDFYAAFSVAYKNAIHETELAIWEEFHAEFETWSLTESVLSLDEKQAAYLTYLFREYLEPPQSHELYMVMAPFARVYEYLLLKKYGKRYSRELFYETLRVRFPPFLLTLIGMDSVINALVSMNLHTREANLMRTKVGGLVTRYSFYEPRFLLLTETDALTLKPAFLEAVVEHAEKQGFKADQVGRTADRGCPFLFTKERGAVLDFAINEIIEQHRAWFCS